MAADDQLDGGVLEPPISFHVPEPTLSPYVKCSLEAVASQYIFAYESLDPETVMPVPTGAYELV